MRCPTARCASTFPGRRSRKTSTWAIGLRVLRNELQRDAGVAIALPRRRRAVVEQVPVVAAAADAVVLGARIDEVEVLLHLEHARDGGEERRPAGTRVELHLGGEERQPASRARENAGALLLVQRARARAL